MVVASPLLAIAGAPPRRVPFVAKRRRQEAIAAGGVAGRRRSEIAGRDAGNAGHGRPSGRKRRKQASQVAGRRSKGGIIFPNNSRFRPIITSLYLN